MVWAEEAEISLIEGEDGFDVATFGDRHDAGIYEVHSTIEVLFEDVGDPVEVLIDQIDWLKSAFLDVAEEGDRGGDSGVASDEIGDFDEDGFGEKNFWILEIDWLDVEVTAIGLVEESDDKSGVCYDCFHDHPVCGSMVCWRRVSASVARLGEPENRPMSGSGSVGGGVGSIGW